MTRLGSGFSAALALALVAIVLPRAVEAAPTHPFLEAASIDGSSTPSGELDKACGVAVDSEGDVYLANSANGSIDVFDPSGTYLTSIADANDPCGLAVDSKGTVYAVDTATGNVVRFAPAGGAHPPTAGLGYEAAVTLDASGDAKAVAVNPANDHVLVNQGIQIVEYDSAANGSGVLKGEIGKGILAQGFGVDVYDATGNVYAADETGQVYVFNPDGTEVLATIDGSESPLGAFGTLPQANVAVNQSNGHVLISDVKEAGAVYEFESTGPYLSTIEHEDFEDAAPSDLAVDPSEETPTSARVYVSSGAGPGAQILAFAPLPTPTHPRLADLDPDGAETPAKKFQNVCGVTVDSLGNVYVTSTGTSAINIFKPEGKGLKYLTTINGQRPCGAAVDSKGVLYVAHPTELTGKNTVTKYVPNKYPFQGTPTYSAPVVVDPGDEFSGFGLTVNPANDHLLVAHRKMIWEYDSAENGSAKLREDIGTGTLSENSGIGVCARTGNVYAVSGPAVFVVDPDTNQAVTEIDGSNAVSKKPDGGFGGLGSSQLAIDQADCHVYVNRQAGDVYEFEESGAYVSRFDRTAVTGPLNGVAVDNSSGPNAHSILAANGVGGPPVVEAYEGPALYGGSPEVALLGAADANGTDVTLKGTVDPGGEELSSCHFEYVDQAAFEATGFATATEAPCVPGPAEIGDGGDPVPVSAHVTGLSSTVQYRFRLVAGNSFGTEVTEPRRFGPPVVTAKEPSSVLYTEATLQGSVDPAGLETTYFFEYGLTDSYGQSSPQATTEGEAPLSVNSDLFGLAQNTTYHFRLVAGNSIATVFGPDQAFTTLEEAGASSCSNGELRSGLSAALPDCRAFELVSPPDVGGRTLGDLRAAIGTFLAPMATPSGNSLLFYTEGALPGTDGNGVKDAYASTRGTGGWITELAGPSGAQSVVPAAGGVSADHRYAFWTSAGLGGSLDVEGQSANYLRKPDGSFELVGQGESAADLDAVGRWITPDGSKLIFTSAASLTSDAPPAGTAAVYERAPGGVARLLSLLPGEATPSAGQDAAYLGSAADGSAVAFRIGSTLYPRRAGATAPVVSGDFAFGGLSTDGERLFYLELPAPTATTAVQRGEAFAYDAAAGTSSPLGSGGETVLANVAADGSRAYFSSRQQLDGVEGVAGEENLYLWQEGTVRFIAVLDSADVESPGDQAAQRLGSWAQSVQPLGPFSADPSRTTPDGGVLVFESLASPTSYDSEGAREVYRYDAGADQLGCVSCPVGQAPGEGAILQTDRFEAQDSPAHVVSQIAGVSADGSAVFFETAVGLVPSDQDGVRDVYEWRAGEVSLISVGGGEAPSYLYAMSSDGHDVFIATSVTLLPADTDGGARSIYDAREGGGFPASPVGLPCQGDECKGDPSGLRVLPAPSSEAAQQGNVARPRKRCRARQRAVRRRGGTRCVAKKRKRAHSRKAAQGKGGRR